VSLSALLASSSAVPAVSTAAAIGTGDDAMTGILSVQRQQLRARVEQLEREAAAFRRYSHKLTTAFNLLCSNGLRIPVATWQTQQKTGLVKSENWFCRQQDLTQAELQSVRADNMELYAKLRYLRTSTSSAAADSVAVAAGGAENR
jgi:hypothetical protein